MSKPNVMVVVIDAQGDFVMPDGRLPVPDADRIVVPGIRFLANLHPDEVAAVLFTFDTHEAATYMGSPENLGDPARGIPGFPLHCEVDTPGWQTVFNMETVPDAIPAWILRKGVFDMWEQPGSDVRVHPLTRQGEDGYSWGQGRDFFISGEPGNQGPGTHPRGPEIRGVDTVRMIGVASDYCVASAIAGFLDRGFRVEVVRDLTVGIAKDVDQVVAERFAGRVVVL